MKRLIQRIRNTDKRRIVSVLITVTLFAAVHLGLSELVGALVDSNPEYTNMRDAATNGYLVGFAVSLLLLDTMRRAGRAIDARITRKAPTA